MEGEVQLKIFKNPYESGTVSHNLITVTVKMYKLHISNQDFEFEPRYSNYGSAKNKQKHSYFETSTPSTTQVI